MGNGRKEEETMKKALSVLLAALLLGLLALPAFAEGYYLGDVNLDGKVTASDARLLMRAAVGMDSISEEALPYSDFDGNGKVSAADARYALRTAVGLEDLSLPGQFVPRPQPTKAELREKWLASFPDSISYGDLESNMTWLVETLGERNWNTGTQNYKVDYIYDRLAGYGFTDLRYQSVYGGGGYNIIATIPTRVQNPDIVLVCAHYDTQVGTGGAVDNSSGTAAILQLAKRFLYAEEDFGVELRFLLTAGEEYGYYGAYAYVNALSDEEADRHVVCLNMDMMGRPNTNFTSAGFYLAVATEPAQNYYSYYAQDNVGSIALEEAFDALDDIDTDYYYSPVRAGLTDIIPFRGAGIPALTLSWRTINSANSYGSDYGLASSSIIHQSYDNIYYFDMYSLYDATRLMAGGIARVILPYTKYAE